MNSLRNNTQQYSFKGGLTRVLSKQLHSQQAIRSFVEGYPRTNGVVGSIPYDWIKNIDNAKRSEVSKQIFECMAKTTKRMRKLVSEVVDFDTAQLEELKKMKVNLKELGVPMRDASQLGSGYFGWAFKLTLDAPFDKKKHYVLKLFYNLSDERFGAFHGNYSEQNAGLFVNKRNFKNLNGVKTYFSDLNSGYMVNEFVDKKSSPLKFRPPERHGLFLTDCNEQNLIKGRLIDYGGIVYLGKTPSAKKIEQTITKDEYGYYLWKQILLNLPLTDELVKGLKATMPIDPYRRVEADAMFQEAFEKSKKGAWR